MNIAEYADYLYGRGYAERTVNEYTKWLRRLYLWCHHRGYDPATLEPHLLRAWADGLPWGWSTRKQARAACRHYYRALGRGSEEPWLAIRAPRKPEPRPDPHTATEALRLRDAAVLIGGRQGLAVLTMLYTGARCSEVAGMRWEEVDLRRGVICWDREKVSDTHELPIAPALRDALEAHRHPRAAGFVFAGDGGRPHVRGATIWLWTKRVAELAEVETSPKRLRATVGSLILAETGDLDAAAGVLGHRSVDTTRRYYVETGSDRIAGVLGSLPY